MHEPRLRPGGRGVGGPAAGRARSSTGVELATSPAYGGARAPRPRPGPGPAHRGARRRRQRTTARTRPTRRSCADRARSGGLAPRRGAARAPGSASPATVPVSPWRFWIGRRADRVGVPAGGTASPAGGRVAAASGAVTTTVTELLDDLQWRGLIALSTDLGALRAALDAGPVTYYVRLRPDGAEPAPRSPRPGAHGPPPPGGRSPAAGARRRVDRPDRRPAADLGADAQHQGDGGRLGGDASASRSSRSCPSRATTPRVMVNNLDWTAPMSAIDFLRDVGKHFRVNKMITKDAVSRAAALRAGHLLHRVQLPDPAGAGLPRAVPAVRLHPAVRGQRPVGQPHRRARPHPPGRARARARVRHAVAHQGRRHQVRQDRGRRPLARSRADLAVRLLPVLAQQRRP